VRVAVDTHALIWFLKGSPLLSVDGRLALRDAEGSDGVVVSAALLVDLWYVTQTTQAFTTEDLDAVRDVVAAESTALELVPVELDVFDAWRGLDRRVLADPWDRFIVATAISEGVPLVTKDEAIAGSGYVTTVW
jgi:PIN domain nuclease of toxin-antitoxin system